MTDERVQLKTLLEKTADAEFLNKMIGFATNRLMELEADGLCIAACHERSPKRAIWRVHAQHGSAITATSRGRGRGALELSTSRSTSYARARTFRCSWSTGGTAERALIAVIQEASEYGISTRSVHDFVRAMGMSGISKREVSARISTSA